MNWVRNDSGEDIPPYSLLRVTGSVAIHGRIVYTVDKPNTTFMRYYMISGDYTIFAGKLGPASMLFGQQIIVAYDNAATPVLGESWGAKPSEWDLFPDRPGFEILAVHPSSQRTLALAVQTPVTTLKTTTNGAISSGGSGEADVKFGATESEYDITIHLNFMTNSESVSNGKEALVRWFPDEEKWVIIGAECEL